MRILITGASSGMGREFAKLLANEDNELILVGRNVERLKEVKNQLSSHNIEIIPMDISDINNCIKLHDKVKDIDLLINNAGFGDYGLFTETSLEKEILMINTNIAALHTLTKLYLKDMKEKDSGHILNVASIAGFLPGPLMATYYATKSYVVRLSEGIREELKKEKSNVHISILCPGPVSTNFEKNANISFKFNGINSTDVCKYTLKHLNKFYIVPGFGIRIAKNITRLIPVPIQSKIVYSLQSSKKRG